MSVSIKVGIKITREEVSRETTLVIVPMIVLLYSVYTDVFKPKSTQWWHKIKSQEIIRIQLHPLGAVNVFMKFRRESCKGIKKRVLWESRWITQISRIKTNRHIISKNQYQRKCGDNDKLEQ